MLNIAVTKYNSNDSLVFKYAFAHLNPNITILEDIEDVTSFDNGILFFGGGEDVTPSFYNETPHIFTSSNLQRDLFESTIFNYYENKNDVLFAGICRGCQFLNVMFGGKLHQDLASINHRHPFYHLVIKENRTKLDKYVKEEIFNVNSTHHQAVDILGDNLIRTLNVGGIIEGIESYKGDKVRAVQSHPEYTSDFAIYTNYYQVLKYLFRLEE